MLQTKGKVPCETKEEDELLLFFPFLEFPPSLYWLSLFNITVSKRDLPKDHDNTH